MTLDSVSVSDQQLSDSAGKESDSSQSESAAELSVYIERLNTILCEIMDDRRLMETPEIQKAIESLESDIKHAKGFLSSPRTARSSPARTAEDVIENLGRSLGLVLFVCRHLPVENKENIEALRREMMNVRYSNLSSGLESEFTNDFESEEEPEEIVVQKEMNEIVEEDEIPWELEDVVLHLRNGEDTEFNCALARLNELINDGSATIEAIVDEDVVQVLFDQLSSKEADKRVLIIRMLRTISAMNEENAENMGLSRYLSALVKSLMGDVEEQREAVGLLSKLAEFPVVRRRIGRIQGCIIMVVSIFYGDDQVAAGDAEKVLKALSSTTQCALNMAEAGYFRPLIQYLKDGSDMSKILMATAISRMQLSDRCRTCLGKDGAIEPLVSMFNKGNLEAKLSALGALQNLSCSRENIACLINSGIVIALLQLLFSVTSVLMTLREPASAILAKIAQSGSILVKHNVAQQMLSLLNVTSPVIQCNLLAALNSIVSHPKSWKIRKKMVECGALQLLFPLLEETSPGIRTGALELIFTTSRDMPEMLSEQLGASHVSTIVSIISSAEMETEKAAAAGILRNLPISHREATDLLVNAKILPVVVSVLSSTCVASSAPATQSLAERIAGLLIRFTVPSDKKLQLLSAEQGLIPVLIKLLSSSSATAKRDAATCLAQLSQNTQSLTKSRKSKWFCVPPSSDTFCKVHDAYCSAKTTFCLVKSGAVSPLVQTLRGNDREAHEAVLSCLSTLLQDDIWENGSNFLAQMSGVAAIIRVIESGNVKAQEKALSMLEKIFRIESHRAEYGDSAQVVLIDLTQNGDPSLKPVAAKLLAHLEILQNQSSYF